MQNHYIEDLEAIEDFEQIVRLIENILKTQLHIDGFSLMIYEKKANHFIHVTPDMQWREIEFLPESMTKNIFQTHTEQMITNPNTDESFNTTIDSADEDKVSTLLLHPFADDPNISIVLSIWKVFEKEKEQVMMPLIVGSQMIGMSTRVKSNIKHKNFEEENLALLSELNGFIINASYKILDTIQKQKNSILNAIEEEKDTFNTPQEIIASLVNVLMGMKTSMDNVGEMAEHLKSQLHKEDKLMSYVLPLYHAIEAINTNITNSLQFSSSNEIIRQLFQNKSTVKTEDFFTHLLGNYHSIICQKQLQYNTFIDPKLPREIILDQRTIYTFLVHLFDFVYKDCTAHDLFDIQIYEEKNTHMLTLAVRYTKKELDDSALETYYNMFNNSKEQNVVDNPLLLSYKHFMYTGGKSNTHYNHETQKLTFTIQIPIEVQNPTPLSTIDIHTGIKVGFLLDKEKDMAFANNIARYLMGMGVEKSQLSGAQKLELFKQPLTHLIIFESRFDEQLLDTLPKEITTRILLIKEGCSSEDDTILFHDYSKIDLEMEKTDLYLPILEEFMLFEVI